jgi:D-Lysine 5,6-aminomutase TIM-barrel domain of alpha subunit
MQLFGDGLDLDALRARAEALASEWAAAAATRTTVGQERAILRLFGVSGVDRSGRPLAAEVVERYLAPDPRRLGGGVALPFAIAMAEYDLPPMELALEVAAGNVDLGLEAELLAEPDRRAGAVVNATRLARTARDRVDANRTARRELLALLGDGPRPWLGSVLLAPAIIDALDEAAAAIEAGASMLRVDVPPGRELAEHLARVGASLDRWSAAPSSRGGLDTWDPSGEPIPSGAQRALSVLRDAVDEAAARRRGYVRLVTEAQALAAPDQAVVAAFERIDGVIADPVREIVARSVDPDRALADHAFAHRILARAGTQILVPAGPLLVAPDFATGIPSDAATRSGRALALQMLAVALARHGGLAAASICVSALPDWTVDERRAPALAAAEIALRRAAFPEHALAFIEPALAPDSAITWHAIVSALLADAGEVDIILRRSVGPGAPSLGTTRRAANVAAALRRSRVPPVISGAAADHARRAIDAADATLASLEAYGWRAIVDQPLGMDNDHPGGHAVAVRTELFDPLAVADTSG